MDYLLNYANHKTDAALRDAGPTIDPTILIESDDAFRKPWIKAFDYAKELRLAFNAYAAAKARIVKESGLGGIEFEKARQVSRELNLERYKVRGFLLLLLILLTVGSSVLAPLV